MSREARKTGKYLHIVVRGIGKQILFEDDADRNKYLFLLKKYSEETGISILAYCLMENHVHMLVDDADGMISSFMKKIGVCYAQHYNQKYERSGHLFQDRFKSEPITTEKYLLSAFRYILNNPYKAGICKAKDYAWSSYKEYGKETGLTDPGILKELIGDYRKMTAFVSQTDEEEYLEAEPARKNDEWALEVIRKKLNIESGTQLQGYDRKQRDQALVVLKKSGLSIRRIERLTGINRGIIQRAR